jgi:hypothetical protein
LREISPFFARSNRAGGANNIVLPAVYTLFPFSKDFVAFQYLRAQLDLQEPRVAGAGVHVFPRPFESMALKRTC